MATLAVILDVLASATIIILSITLAHSVYIDSKKKRAGKPAKHLTPTPRTKDGE